MSELEYSYSMSDLRGTIVGRYTSIAGGCTFHEGDNHPWVEFQKAVSNFPFKEKNGWDYPPCGGKGRSIIGHDVWLGECVRVLSGTVVGNGAIIGAGAVISGNIPAFAVVVGNPGKVIKYRFSPDIIEKLESIAWWGWDEQTIKDAMPYMADVNQFVERYYGKK